LTRLNRFCWLERVCDRVGFGMGCKLQLSKGSSLKVATSILMCSDLVEALLAA
jgi:hypothetical protein